MLGTCMQGRGRRDEDVDDEAVHDDVACAPPWSCKTCAEPGKGIEWF